MADEVDLLNRQRTPRQDTVADAKADRVEADPAGRRREAKQAPAHALVPDPRSSSQEQELASSQQQRDDNDRGKDRQLVRGVGD